MDLDVTVIIQLFLVLMALVIGARALGRPFLRAILERETLIEGTRGKAALLEQQIKQLDTQYNEILTEKRLEIKNERKAQIIHTRGALQVLQHNLQDEQAKKWELAAKELHTYEEQAQKAASQAAPELTDKLLQAILPKAK